jgi:Flp pilus assembly protein TadG
MRQQMFRRLRDERGVVLILFTVMFMLLIGFAALVADIGLLWWYRRELQNAADSAALAGAVYLPGDPDQARTVAITYAQRHLVGTSLLTPPEITATVGTLFNTNDALTVTVRRPLTFGLRYILGAGDLPVAASATAVVAAMNPSDLWPWGVTRDTACPQNQECQLKLGAPGEQNGNFRAMDFDGSGARDYKSYILNGYSGPVPPPACQPGTAGCTEPYWQWGVPGETGNMAGPTKDALDTLFAWDREKRCDGGQTSCASFYTPGPGFFPVTEDGTVCVWQENGQIVANTRCPRVGIVPFISETWDEVKGKSTMTVVDFGCFYLTRYEYDQPTGQMIVYGRFLDYCRSVGGGNGTGLYGVPLDASGMVGVFLWR